MATGNKLFRLPLALFLLCVGFGSQLVLGRGGISPLQLKEVGKSPLRTTPPSCSRIECPSYDLIDDGEGFEIRRYNSTVWMSTSPIQDISFNKATRTGFLQLFNYIQGKNFEWKKMEMTAPVLTRISPSDGPFCESSFTVSFYVPKLNQPNPPKAVGLQAETWGRTFTAVRQFSGFVSDDDIGKQAAALKKSLIDSKWAAIIKKSHRWGGSSKSGFIVAQYNSPFEFEGRVNEIWLTFDMEEEKGTVI